MIILYLCNSLTQLKKLVYPTFEMSLKWLVLVIWNTIRLPCGGLVFSIGLSDFIRIASSSQQPDDLLVNSSSHLLDQETEAQKKDARTYTRLSRRVPAARLPIHPLELVQQSQRMKLTVSALKDV